MFSKYLTTTSFIAALAMTPIAVTPAQAQVDDARGLIGGLLLGGAIVAGIAGAQQPQQNVTVIPPTDPRHPQYNPNAGQQPPASNPRPQQPRPQANYTPPRPAIPATEAGRQVQTALNYFGFNAGYVDGQVGPATRAAVERYQAALGYPVNGSSFPEPQAQYLIGAYLWATNGGAAQSGGLTGAPLLVAYQDVLNGTTGPTIAGGGNTTVIVNPATTTVVPQGGAPVTTASASGTPEVPNLFAGASDAPVLSSRCDAVALQGQANGGMMTLGNLTNPGFALSEQFCTARASAVNQGHDLTEAIVGMTYEQVSVQCEGFSAALATQTSLIGIVSPQQATASAQGFAITTGIPQAELAATARVCLGVGYGADNMEMAMGSALILVASGEPAYGELLGHHLREGYGVTADDHRAHEWYDASLNALAAGAPAVFSPSDAGRLPLIRQAVAVSFGGQLQPTPTALQPQVPTIPGAATFAPQAVAPAPTIAPTIAPTPVPQQVAGVQPAPVQVPTPAPAGNEPRIEPLVVDQEPNITGFSLPTFEVQQ